MPVVWERRAAVRSRLFIRQFQIYGSKLGARSEFADLIERVGRRRLTPGLARIYSLPEIHPAFDRLQPGAQFKVGVETG